MKKEADAKGNAAIVREQGLAEADAIKAKLLAEAEGIKEKAEAYAKLDQTGKFLEVLNALQTLGPNLVKEFAGVMASATAHLSNVDEIKVIDFGGQGKGGSSVGNFGSAPVEILTKFFEATKGVDLDATKLFNFLGVKPEDVAKETTKKDDGFESVDGAKK